MGAEVGAMMGLSALMNLIAADTSSSSQMKTNAMMMRFNAQEAEKNRQFQSDMYNRQLNDQRNFYNQYQSPAAISRQLADLGVNSASVLGSGSGIGVSPGSVPSPPGGSQASVSGLGNPGASSLQSMDSMSKMIDTISNSALRDKQALKAIAETKGVEKANALADFNLYLTQKYGENEKVQQLNNLILDAALKDANKDYTASQTSLNKALKMIYDQELDIKKEEYGQLLIRGIYLAQTFEDAHSLNQEYINTEKTKQSLNRSGVVANRASANRDNSQAALNYALTKTVDSLRDGQITAQFLSNSLAEIGRDISLNDLWFSNRTTQAKVDAFLEGLKQAQLITDQEYYKLSLMRKEDAWSDRMHYQQYWTGFFNSASNAVSSGSGYYNGSINRMNNEDKLGVQREFNEIIKSGQKWMRYTDEEGTIYHTPWR